MPKGRCQKTNAKYRTPKHTCQKSNAKEIKHDLSSNQHTEKVMKDKKTKEKVNILQCPSSLKQMNFKMKCF